MNSESINILLSVLFCVVLIIGILIFFAIYVYKNFVKSNSELQLDIEDSLSYYLDGNNEFLEIRCKLTNPGRDKIRLISTTAFLDNLQSTTKDYNPYIHSVTSEARKRNIFELQSNETVFANLKFKIDNKNVQKVINEFKYEVFLHTYHYENSIMKGQPVQDSVVFGQLNQIKNKYMYRFFETISLTKGDYIFSLKINYFSDEQRESNLDKLSFAFDTNNQFEMLLDRFLRKQTLEILNYPLTVDTKVAAIVPDSIEKL